MQHGPRGAVVVDRAAIRFNDDVFAVDAAVWRAVASRDALRAMDTHACECRRLRRLFKKVAITKRGVSRASNFNECALDFISPFLRATGSRQLRPNQPSLTVVSLSLYLNRLKVFNLM